MLDRVFDPKSFEENFSFDIEASERKSNADPFMILLPPPNVTGSLHIGHSLCFTLQDILARYKRLKGFDVLFQPGLDHAGIVTQLLVEKKLYDSGAQKGALTREILLKEIWFWKEHSGGTILDQMKKLGISCDFSKLRFTLDDKSQKAVAKMFVDLYKHGLLYRGQRMVNWDPLICSAISDLEVVEKEIDGHLWYIRYTLDDSSDSLIIATSRPETLFGDVAVAVNPKDERYKKFIGKNVKVPLIDRVVPVIADKYADPEKGTGAVKITPAHDFNDFEVGRRHKLQIIDIFNARAELNENAPDIFRGMDRFEARKKVVELLEKLDLLVKVENIKQTLPFGDRSGVVLEPRLTYQWFVNAEKLAKPAIEAVKNGAIRFVPKHWENLYFEWLENIRPWCVSRQIWWGHRIPAWYGPDGQVFVAETESEALKQAIKFYGNNSVKIKQDEDVLDTWFSSGMWTFITLGWPQKTADLHRFFSNMVVVTGFDIIFFWVSRMIMMALFAMKEVPFREVYIHGLVRDEKGHKMSKSKGNVVDPLMLCDKYGTDAVRYTLASMASPGRDLKISNQLVETGRNFLTKLWNVVRFAQMNGCANNNMFDPSEVLHPLNKWIIFEIKNMVSSVEESLDNYRFDDASRFIYQTVWNSFCDWYMELIKPILQQSALDDSKVEGYNLTQTLLKKEVRDTVAWAILQFVKVLYPIAPFISKKLSGELGVVEMSWPKTEEIDIDFKDAIRDIDLLKEIISAVRSVRQCLHIPTHEKLQAKIEISNAKISDFMTAHREVIFKMAGISFVDAINKSVPVVLNGAVLHVGVEGKIDVDRELVRLSKEVHEFIKMRDAAMFRLNNQEFINKASESVIDEHRKRVETLGEKINKTEYVIHCLEIVK
ncbi:MAG: valine--tRNA ligase [Alphaproteobacteria bacterium]|nr:valine--tRNA ligase [Alphaproteobacteria bacterium]